MPVIECYMYLLLLLIGGLVAKSCPTLATPWTVACQAPLSMGFSGKNTGVDCHFLLQGIFPTQESNPGLLHCRQILYQLNYEGSIITTTCHKNIYLYPYNSEPFGENNRGLYVCVCVCVHVCTHMCIHAYGRACTHVSLQISDY